MIQAGIVPHSKKNAGPRISIQWVKMAPLEASIRQECDPEKPFPGGRQRLAGGYVFRPALAGAPRYLVPSS